MGPPVLADVPTWGCLMLSPRGGETNCGLVGESQPQKNQTREEPEAHQLVFH